MWALGFIYGCSKFYLYGLQVLFMGALGFIYGCSRFYLCGL